MRNNDLAPRPTLGLTIAIAGHRPDRLLDPAAVQARIGELLADLQSALAATPLSDRFEPRPPRLRLITALAEGSDRLAAIAALNLGVAVDAVLPFALTEYERDFAQGAARDGFQDLLERCETVLILDGAGEGAARDRAYDAAGRALLDNSDLLIAVWDGEPGRGRGGTREVIAEAVRRGLPVVVVPPDGSNVTLRRPPPDPVGIIRLEDVPETSLDGLGALVAGLVGGPVESPWPGLLRPPSRPLLYSAYPLLMRLLGLGRKRARSALAGTAAASAPARTLEQAFAWWDGSATVAAQAFRSAVIVNFGLAALAVVLAALSLFSGDAKWVFVVAEIVAILLLLVNTWRVGRARWHDRWLESREVAERLRVCLMLRRVGIGRGRAAADEPGWKAWYLRALVRGSALQPADLSDVASASGDLLAEVSGQADWNATTAERMHAAGRRMERVGEILFVLVLAAAIGWLVLWAAVPDTAEALKTALTALTAGLPAVATASYGVRVILDFEGVSERSRRIASALEAAAELWRGAPGEAAALQTFAARAGSVMLGDVVAWRLLAEGRRLSIPG